jgi:hypothetical protein
VTAVSDEPVPPIAVGSRWMDDEDGNVLEVDDCYMTGDEVTWLVELDDGRTFTIRNFLALFIPTVPA